MTTQLTINVLLILFTALATYFISNQTSRKMILSEVLARVESAMETHNAIEHKADIYAVADARVSKHETTCNGNARLTRIEKMLVYLIVKAGGSLHEVGLNDPT
jgi:hypothetical protein